MWNDEKQTWRHTLAAWWPKGPADIDKGDDNDENDDDEGDDSAVHNDDDEDNNHFDERRYRPQHGRQRERVKIMEDTQ